MSNPQAAFSHGRGGAGNISKERRGSSPADLTTPMIKSDTYTTGRGGSGNMAKNNPAHPEIARASQDVEASPAAHVEPHGKVHIGRGGAGNLVDARDGKEGTNKEKGKQLLGKLGLGGSEEKK